jgi:hypothetical protein
LGITILSWPDDRGKRLCLGNRVGPFSYNLIERFVLPCNLERQRAIVAHISIATAAIIPRPAAIRTKNNLFFTTATAHGRRLKTLPFTKRHITQPGFRSLLGSEAGTLPVIDLKITFEFALGEHHIVTITIGPASVSPEAGV